MKGLTLRSWIAFSHRLSNVNRSRYLPIYGSPQLGDQFRKVHEVETKGQSRLAYPIFFLLTVIFGSTAFLAHNKTITSEAFLILGGTVVGYLLSFLGDYVAPHRDRKMER